MDKLVERFIKNKWALTKGAGQLSEYWHHSVEEIKAAKAEARKILGNPTRFQIIAEAKGLVKPEIIHESIPKILIFDIETAPLRAYVWRRFKENISLDQTISEWFMIAWSAKWLYDAEVMGEVLTPEEIEEENDKRLCESLWKLIDEADIVVAYNGVKFDVPKINTRFIINGMLPPKPYKIVDPMLTAKYKFAFSSNKMDNLATQLGIANKLDTDFNLWKKCMEGDKESLDYMLQYNKQDVKTLEEIYIKMLPWIKNHPNVQNYIDSNVPVCSHCGCKELTYIPGRYYYTNISKYKISRCNNCGAVIRDRNNLNITDHKSVPVMICPK